ncbi:hypothetical protein RhiJN_00340 [Ceratobasidium sp. AG-Ba]|nr:hypothetical protein RhiJN_00340 [Ceratobasidium sp. AG-Ba]QRW01368.1 hypothetical protein RhiLY_00365 [Ceratobasidium sp. AG-Ba]
MLVLGGLSVHILAYAYLVTISRLACTLSPLRLVYWVVLILSVKHVFEINDLLGRVASITKYTILVFIIREDILVQQLRNLGLSLRKAFFWYAFLVVRLAMYVCIAALRLSLWLVTRLLFKHILVPAVRRLVFKFLCWTCIICTMGCVVAAIVSIELFAALLVPVYYTKILIRRQYKPIEDITGDFRSPAFPLEPSESSVPEEVLSTPSSPSSSSHSTTSEGVRRLGRLVNAYLGDSGSSESVVDLERQFENTPSMHAPPPGQMISPPTRFPLPATPDLPHDQTFEYPDEDEEVSALATQFSGLHMKPESSSAPRESRRALCRSTITFAVFNPSSHPGWVSSIWE